MEIRHARQQSLGENPGQRRNIHLNKIGKIAIKGSAQHFAQDGVVAPDSEDAVAAQQIKVAHTVPIVEILASAATKADVVAYSLQDPDHLLVEMATMDRKAAALVLLEQSCDVASRSRL